MFKFRLVDLHYTSSPWTVSLIVDKTPGESYDTFLKQLEEIFTWCAQKEEGSIRIREIVAISIAFDFKDKRDATMFKLKWGGSSNS